MAIDWILGHLAPEVDITVGHYHFTDLAYVMMPVPPSLCLISFKQTVSSNHLMPLLLRWA